MVAGVADKSENLSKLRSIVRLLSCAHDEFDFCVADVLAGCIAGLRLTPEDDEGTLPSPTVRSSLRTRLR